MFLLGGLWEKDEYEGCYDDDNMSNTQTSGCLFTPFIRVRDENILHIVQYVFVHGLWL